MSVLKDGVLSGKLGKFPLTRETLLAIEGKPLEEAKAIILDREGVFLKELILKASRRELSSCMGNRLKKELVRLEGLLQDLQ